MNHDHRSLFTWLWLSLWLSLWAACVTPLPAIQDGPIKVAACQILVDGDPEAALARVDAALGEAVALGAQIACFPEACVLGWVNPEAHTRAGGPNGATVKRLQELARRHRIMFAVGLVQKEGESLHNVALLIDRDGEVLLRHRKVNIMQGLMEPAYVAGDEEAASVVDTRLGRIGLLVCADTFKDTLVNTLAQARPDLVLVPYGWAAPEGDWPGHGKSLHAWISNTALKTGAPVLGVDSVGALGHGPWTGFVLGGQSACAGSSGELHGVLADREAQVPVFPDGK